MTERLCRDMYSELIMKGYLTPDIRSRVIDSAFGGVGVCGPPPTSPVDDCADGSVFCGWGDISAEGPTVASSKEG